MKTQLYIIGMMLVMVACNAPQKEETPASGVEIKAADAPHDGHEIVLTQEQFKAMKIELGGLERGQQDGYVSATGMLSVPSTAYTVVNAKTKGYLSTTHYYIPGDFVKAGTVIARIEEPALIQLQQQYLEAKASLAYAEQELVRQNDLLAADAGIEKQQQAAATQVARGKAQVSSLGKQLAFLGIDVAGLSPDQLVSSVPVVAPATGYVTRAMLRNGEYVTPDKPLLELLATSHIHLELDVFERDLARVQVGEKITYQAPALGQETYKGEVHVISKTFDAVNKTVRVHGHLEGKQPTFVDGAFVQAKIWHDTQLVDMLPDEAVVRSGQDNFIYVTQAQPDAAEFTFEKVAVSVGNSLDGRVVVTPFRALKPNERIVVKGTYYVDAAGKAGDMAHEH